MFRTPLDPFALELGRLCFCWSELELVVTNLFVKVAAPAGHSKALYPMVACLDFRDRVAALKVGCIAGEHYPTSWANALIEELNYIDNNIRPFRNRYIHDYWWIDDDGDVNRNTLSYKLHRLQARQPWSVKTATISPEDISAITALRIEVATRTIWLTALYDWTARRRAPSLTKLLARRPQPRPPPYPQETPHPAGSAPPTPKAQPES